MPTPEQRFDPDAAIKEINKGAEKVVILHYDARHIDGLRFMQLLYKFYDLGLNDVPDGGILEIMLEREKA